MGTWQATRIGCVGQPISHHNAPQRSVHAAHVLGERQHTDPGRVGLTESQGSPPQRRGRAEVSTLCGWRPCSVTTIAIDDIETSAR